MLDIARMRQIAEELYVHKVTSVFGENGVTQLRTLLDLLIQLYSRHDPASRSYPLVVMSPVHTPATFPAPALHSIQSISNLTDQIDGACCVVVQSNGTLRVYDAGAVDVLALSESHIVYEYNAGSEKFLVSRSAYNIINPSPAHASVFARPTFSTLLLALEDYKNRIAKYSSCQILQGVWHDDKRIFFKKKPEATMRKSLNQFLSHVLENAEVRPEQNVDETHPVDVKVTWVYSSQRAIVEIKWLGDSMGDDGQIGTSYRDSRALSGAQQLADYLDQSDTWGGTVHTRGYLVVFDARRRGLNASTTSVSREDGLHYKDSEISYAPDFATLRPDFSIPTRMFMHPIMTEAAA